MITAVVLAAGQSRRMGRPKINLPWPPPCKEDFEAKTGCRTVLGQVVATLLEVGVEDIRVVTGGVAPIEQPHWVNLPVKLVHNPRFAEGEMLSSLQAGLHTLPAGDQAALVVLGDQPQISASVVCAILAAHPSAPESLIVPSYRMRRGHPWLLPSCLWGEVLRLSSPSTLRDFLQAHASQIQYVPVDTITILQDLDTPEEYQGYGADKPLS